MSTADGLSREVPVSVLSWLSKGAASFGGRSTATSSTLAGLTGRQLPQSHDDWCGEGGVYSQREAAYLGAPYALAEILRDHLFRALDSEGNILAETRRLTRDVAFVVDTDVSAIAGGKWTLEPGGEEDSDKAMVDAGLAVWKRSGLVGNKGRWVRWGASMGDVVLEPLRGADGLARVVAYDPRSCRIEYDLETGTQIERAYVSIPHYAPTTIDSMGRVAEDPMGHEYLRVIDRDEIRVYLDGKLQDGGESGPHGLGVCPVVHLPYLPYTDPCHGLWAAQGLDAPLSMVDSLLTQVAAIGNRHANPILANFGFKLGEDGGAVFALGRMINGAPADGRSEYIEASLQGITALLDAATKARENARETLPEFLFTDASAASSGRSLNFRAAQFVAKMSDVRERYYDGISRATAYGVAMDEGAAWDEDRPLPVLVAPPVLPVSVPDEVDVLHAVLKERGITRVDYVQHLQRLGVVPDDADPEAYVAQLEAEKQADTDREVDALQRGLADVAPKVETQPMPTAGEVKVETVE